MVPSGYVPDAEYYSQHYYQDGCCSSNLTVEQQEGCSPPPHGIARIQTVGRDGWCGCPGCNTTRIHIECEQEPIHEVWSLYNTQEWTKFTKRIRRIIHDNTCPCMPTCCFHCIPGVSGAHFMANLIYLHRREVDLQELLDEENVRLAEVGLKWTKSSSQWNPCNPCTPEPKFSFTLTWLPVIREAYELAHPDRRNLTREPYPLQLLSPKQRANPAVIQLEENSSTDRRLLALSGDTSSPPAPSAIEMTDS